MSLAISVLVFYGIESLMYPEVLLIVCTHSQLGMVHIVDFARHERL